MLAILDYKAGNQTSVRRALEHLGIPCSITADPAVLESAQGVIFPGVGAAGQAMGHLQGQQAHGLCMAEVLTNLVRQGKPLLGICLGCQILLDRSEENNTRTLGLVPGECLRFAPELCDAEGRPVRIPHMGWNSIAVQKESCLLAGLPEGTEFYFVHSYYARPAEELIIATTRYGLDFCSVYGRDGLWAVQFHLEKSGTSGLHILHNFYGYCQGEEAGHAQ